MLNSDFFFLLRTRGIPVSWPGWVQLPSSPGESQGWWRAKGGNGKQDLCHSWAHHERLRVRRKSSHQRFCLSCFPLCLWGWCSPNIHALKVVLLMNLPHHGFSFGISLESNLSSGIQAVLERVCTLVKVNMSFRYSTNESNFTVAAAPSSTPALCKSSHVIWKYLNVLETFPSPRKTEISLICFSKNTAG